MNIAKTTNEIGKQLKKANNYMANNYKLLNNRFLLYFVLILVIIDMFLFVRVGEVFYIFLYILFGLLVSLQTSNMMIILASSMILTNIVKYGLRNNKIEGFVIEGLGQDIFEALGDKEQAYFRKLANGEEQRPENLSKEENDTVDEILNYLLGESKKTDKEENKETETSSTSETVEPPSSESDTTDPVKKLVGFASDKKLKNIDGLEKEALSLIKTQEALQANMKTLEPMLKQAESFMSELKNIKASNKK